MQAKLAGKYVHHNMDGMLFVIRRRKPVEDVYFVSTMSCIEMLMQTYEYAEGQI